MVVPLGVHAHEHLAWRRTVFRRSLPKATSRWFGHRSGGGMVSMGAGACSFLLTFLG